MNSRPAAQIVHASSLGIALENATCLVERQDSEDPDDSSSDYESSVYSHSTTSYSSSKSRQKRNKTRRHSRKRSRKGKSWHCEKELAHQLNQFHLKTMMVWQTLRPITDLSLKARHTFEMAKSTKNDKLGSLCIILMAELMIFTCKRLPRMIQPIGIFINSLWNYLISVFLLIVDSK